MSLALSLVVVLTGCGSKELTRGKAQRIIEDSDLYKTGQHAIALNATGMRILVQHGFLSASGFGLYHFDLTALGKKYLKSVTGDYGVAGIGVPLSTYSVTTLREIRPRVVEITGIRGDNDQNEKVVDYKWRWEADSEPQELKKALPALDEISEASVVFQLYDDGWRVDWNKPIGGTR